MSDSIIRKVRPEDAASIAAIYNHYVLNTVVSFETEPLSAEAMSHRIQEISASFPYLVCEEDGAVIGYCYVHQWKARPAYSHTLETSVYLDHRFTSRGVGRRLMEALISDCRSSTDAHALIACITAENETSRRFHRSLGFTEVSHFRQVGFKQSRWLDVVDLEMLL